METTNITDTFSDGTVLITGSTGFLGKLLAEKLLRSCTLKSIAVLVRSKRGLTAEQRMTDVFKHVVFDRLRSEKPDFTNRIKIINGDIVESSLDLSSTDRDWLIENVNFVFHCAATVKFNEPLQLATKVNVQGTENVLALATGMKNLKGFVHVSTAYSHCPRREIKEEYYPVPVTARELKNLLDLDEPTLNVSNDWPNTYTFTKAIAENLISTNENHLPISVFRPSIVGCMNSEPCPGWFENMIGPPGIIAGVMVGIIRVLLVDEDKVFDLVPADFTVNALISVMCDTVNRHRVVDGKDEYPKIYNYVSGAESPLTWGRYNREMYETYRKAPPLRSTWYPFNICYTNLWVGRILRLCLHRIPAAFMDLLLIINGQKPKMMKIYSKTDNLMDLYHTFSTNEWKFDNSNIRELWLSMSAEERHMFRFSLKEFDWKTYIERYYYGIRKYILYEDLNNVAKAKAKNRRLFWLHIFFVVFTVYFAVQLCRILVAYVY